MLTQNYKRIKAVLFDFDGTLTQPESLNLADVKDRIGCPREAYILEYIHQIDSVREQRRAYAVLEAFELQAARHAQPNTGAEALIRTLRTRGIRIGILSRNSAKSIHRSLANFKHLTEADFDLIISRDDPLQPKPSSDGVRHAAKKLGIDPSEILVVGDFILDIEAGRRAGAMTVLLENEVRKAALPIESDCRIGRLEEVANIIRFGLPLAPGKLPNRILEHFLDQFRVDDASVLIKPGIGEDTAAVDISEHQVLVLKSDPITFATDAIGQYAVWVNANDIATAGACPRWFLTTLLFPVGTSTADVRQTMQELSTICQKWHITLCGGHTEITDAVSRPVVTGMMAGTVSRSDLIDKRHMKSGDLILITKKVAVEGTAIIAREFGETLARKGMSRQRIAACGRFLDNISILQEARIATGFDAVSAMHDVTEGGLVTALEEISIAGRHRLKIDLDAIPVYTETETICRHFALNPLGLIGSGSLIICCRPQAAPAVVQAIQQAHIEVTCIGEVQEPGKGVVVVTADPEKRWPVFEVDEISKLFGWEVG
jgi:HAD superfamily hydrolase (TIGR01509 family)